MAYELKDDVKLNITKSIKLDPSLGVRMAWTYSRSKKEWEPGGDVSIGFGADSKKLLRYFILGGWPFFVEGQYGAQGTTVMECRGLDLDDPSAKLDGRLNISGYLELYAAVGIHDLLNTGLSGKGTVNFEFEAINKPVKLTDADLNIDVFWRVEALLWSYEGQQAHWHWDLYGRENRSAGANVLRAVQNKHTFTEDVFTEIMPRNTVTKERFLAPNAQATTPDTPAYRVVNVFKNASPKLNTRVGDQLLVWLRDNSSRHTQNRTELVVQRKVGNSWSTPIAIADDGTADFAPQTALLPNGDILVAWQNTSTALDADAVLTDALPKQEISAAVVNSSGVVSAPFGITNNTYLDGRPQLVSAPDGSAHLFWLANTSNSMFGSLAQSNVLMVSHWNGTTWSSADSVRGGLGLVTEYCVAYTNSKACVYIVVDEDDNLSTDQDRDLYMLTYNGTSWSELARVTDNDATEACPMSFYLPNNGFLCVWTDDGVVMQSASPLLDDATPIYDENTTVGANVTPMFKDGVFAGLVWTQKDEGGYPSAFKAAYDITQRTWMQPVKMFGRENFSRAYSGFIKADGDISLAFVEDTLESDVDGYKWISQSDLVVRDVPSLPDLQIVNISSNIQQPSCYESVTITTTVVNRGDATAPASRVSFFMGDPSVSANCFETITLSELAPGSTQILTRAWTFPRVSTTGVVLTGERNLYAVVDPVETVIENNENNNVGSIVLQTSDLEIVSVQFYANPAKLIVGVKNRGFTDIPANILLTVRQGSMNGGIVGQTVIDPLGSSLYKEYIINAALMGQLSSEVKLYVHLDQSNQFTEVNKSNNQKVFYAQLNVTSISENLQAFRVSHGLAADGSQDSAAPAGDGVANLLKYAFNMIGGGAGQAGSIKTPNVAKLVANGATGLPMGEMDNSGRLQVTYIRRKITMTPGISYTVEFSDALSSWAFNSLARESVTDIDTIFERVTVTDSVTTPTRFARVRVTSH